MKAPPPSTTATTKISQFRLVYGITDKINVTAQPKDPVSHTNTTIQIYEHASAWLHRSPNRSLCLCMSLLFFSSIPFNLLLSSFLFMCTFHLINDECPKDHLTVGHHHYHKHNLSLEQTHTRTCIFQPIRNWFYWVTQFVLTIFIEIRKLCAICHPNCVPWQTFLAAFSMQHAVFRVRVMSDWCAHSIPQFYMQTKAKWNGENKYPQLCSMVSWIHTLFAPARAHGQPYGNSRERTHRPYHK